MSQDLLLEIVNFLKDEKPAVRSQAAEYIQNFSGSEDGIKLLKKCDKLLANLVRLIGDMIMVSKPTIIALINLCEDSEIRVDLSTNSLISRIMENLRDPEYPLINLNLMLLANVTISEMGSGSLLQMKIQEGDNYGYHLNLLIGWFCNEKFLKNVTEENPSDPYQYIATILNNITQVEEGRVYISEPSKPILRNLMQHLNSVNEIRRLGISGMFRNICLSQQLHEYLIYCKEMNYITVVLKRLHGPEILSELDMQGMDPEIYKEGINKKRESNLKIIHNLLEALVLISNTLVGRNALRRTKSYPIVRTMHKTLKEVIDEPTEELIFDFVDRVMGDESTENMRKIKELKKKEETIAKEDLDDIPDLE